MLPNGNYGTSIGRLDTDATDGRWDIDAETPRADPDEIVPDSSATCDDCPGAKSPSGTLR